MGVPGRQLHGHSLSCLQKRTTRRVHTLRPTPAGITDWKPLSQGNVMVRAWTKGAGRWDRCRKTSVRQSLREALEPRC